MRVYERDLAGSAPSESGRSSDTQKLDRGSGTAPALSGGSSGDRVELSSGLASVSRALASENSDRANKVLQLATQFQDGSYEPSSLAISQGLVAEALTAGAH